MRYEEEPLGCFEKASYGLLGLGLYVFCSLISCVVLLPITSLLNLDTKTAVQSTLFTLPSVPQLLRWGISLFCVGPVILGIYILYLRDMRVIQVKDRVAPVESDEKRKKARRWPI